MHAATRLRRAVLALVAIGLLSAPAAQAKSSFETLYHEYQSTGSIKSCKHSSAELQAAQNQVPPDIAQYAPDFPAALQASLQARAHGVCGGAAAAAPTLGPAGTPAAGAGPGAAAPIPSSGTAPGPTPGPVASPAT